MKRPILTPPEELAAAIRASGELVGHSHQHVLRFAVAMSELANAEDVQRRQPDHVVSPAAEGRLLTRLRRLLGRC